MLLASDPQARDILGNDSVEAAVPNRFGGTQRKGK